jgi:hypothetical protein
MSQSDTNMPIENNLLSDCAHGHGCCSVGCSCCQETKILVLDTLELSIGNGRRLIGTRQQFGYPTSLREVMSNPSYQIDTLSDPSELRNYGKRQGYSFNIIDSSGASILDEPFETISSFKGFYYIGKDNLFGIMDAAFQWIHKPKFYGEIPTYGFHPESKGLLPVVLVDKKYGLIDFSGKIILAFEYDNIHFYGPKIITEHQGMSKIFDPKMREFIIGPFPHIDLIYKGENAFYYKVRNEKGYFGTFDTVGKKELDTNFDFIEQGWDGKYWMVKKKGKMGVYGKDFSLLIPLKFDSIIVNQNILVKQGNLWGVYDLKGKKLSDCVLKLAPRPYNGFMICEDAQGLEVGAIRTHVLGKTNFIPPNYSTLSPTFPRRKEGKYYCVVKRNNGYGILEANENKLVIPMEYDQVKTKKYFVGSTSNRSHTDIYLRKGNLWALFKEEGKALKFTITNISEETNKGYQHRYGIRTVIDFW